VVDSGRGGISPSSEGGLVAFHDYVINHVVPELTTYVQEIREVVGDMHGDNLGKVALALEGLAEEILAKDRETSR
jgi:hypothetical protein